MAHPSLEASFPNRSPKTHFLGPRIETKEPTSNMSEKQGLTRSSKEDEKAKITKGSKIFSRGA